MNKLEQAARQALGALVGMQHGTDWNNGTHAKIYRPKFPAAITALREALAVSEQQTKEQAADEWYEKLLWDKRDGIEPATDYPETYDQGGTA